MNILIWDFDGTLAFREKGAWTAAVYEVLAKHEPVCGITYEALESAMQQGFPWQKPEQSHPHLGDADVWWQNLLPIFVNAYQSAGISLARANELAAYVRPTYLMLQRWHCYDDAISTLKLLTAIGWKHVMLTNHVPELPDILAHLGLQELFINVFNSAQTGYEKPNQRAFALVINRYPDAVHGWMIGDSYQADVCGAAAVGISSILVHQPNTAARHYCATLREIPDFLMSESPQR